LPIAANQDLSSLKILLDKYNVTETPAIILNNKEVIYNIEDIDYFL
jgi:hypothetical protein